MSLKANPRSRGKRPSSNRLAVEQIMRDAEKMVNRDHADPEAVRAFLLANAPDLLPMAPEGMTLETMRETIAKADSVMFRQHERTTVEDPNAKGGYIQTIRTDDTDAPLPTWRLVKLFGHNGARAIENAREAHRAKVASEGPSLVIGTEGDTFELSAARLLAMGESLRGVSSLALATVAQPEAVHMIVMDRMRLVSALRLLLPRGPIVATLQRDPPTLAPLPGPIHVRENGASTWHKVSGPRRLIPGRLVLTLEWSDVGRMRFWSPREGFDANDTTIVPLVVAEEWAPVHDSEVTYVDAAE